MTFLAPIPALVAAAVCVPALLVLYLLKLRRRPVRVGSILFWPRASEDVQANVPLRWLKPTWLLFLHLVALACLLVAFARPAVEGIGIAGERVVVIVDASASMSAVDEGETLTRLERAKERAKTLARDARRAGAAGVAVVELAARARPVTGFSKSETVVRAAIEAVEATDQPGDLAAALQLVDAMGQDAEVGAGGGASDGDAPTVFLVSDGSFDARGDMPATTARLRFERIGPERGRDAPEPVIDNVGVVRLAARRDERDAGLLRVFGELVNAAAAPVDVPVILAVDGRTLEARVVPVAAQGRAAVLFDVRGVSEGVVTLLLSRPDALASDDAASVVLTPARPPRIAVVRARARSAEGAQAWLLDDVLAELQPREVVRVTPEQYEQLVVEGSDRSFDLLVMDGVGVSAAVRVPSLCLGVVPAAPGLEAGPVFAVRAGSVYWDRGHPLMQGVPLDNLVVREARRVRFAEAEGAEEPVVLARTDDAPLLFVVEQGQVRSIVTAFELGQSNWQLTPSFAVFVANAVDELTLRARSAEGRGFKTDEVVSVVARATGGVVLEGPVRVVVREGGEAGVDGNEVVSVSAGVMERAGVYLVNAGEGAGVTRAVAVNVWDEVETELASPSSVRVEGKDVGSVQPTRVPREVWHWFVVAALALLAVEWVVYARQVRA